jgi:hypothetical protein
MPTKIREFTEATGFDVQRDVDKLTAGRIGQRDVLAIVHARFDRFKVEQFVVSKADHIESETYLGRVIYKPHNTDTDRSGGVSFIDNMIVAGNLNAVKQAIDRMAAPAPSVVQNTELMNEIRSIEAGNQIWAAGKFDPQLFGTTPVEGRIDSLAHSLKTGTYQMRLDQDVHLRATGNFTSPEMAKASTDMLRGLLAMAKLQFSQEEKLARLLDGVNIESSADQLTVSFSATGDLIKQIQEMRAGRMFGR